MKTIRLLILAILLLFISCIKNTTIIFQDDFEKYDLQKQPISPWVKSGGGQVYLDTTRAFSGKKAVFFNSGEGFQNRAFISVYDLFNKETEFYYGSLKMYIEEASPDGIHWTMIQASGKTEKNFTAEVRYGGQHNQRLMANYDTKGIKSDCWHHTKFKIPEKRWFSLKWYMNRKTNNMKLWLDKELVHELKGNNLEKGCLSNDNNGDWTFPFFETITLGWVDYQKKGGDRKVWIDDVILSSKNID